MSRDRYTPTKLARMAKRFPLLRLGEAGAHTLRERPVDLLPGRARAGNWAEYTPRWQPPGFAFCGWMDFHTDRDGVDEFGRVWRFRPYYWAPDTVFVHTRPKADGGGLVAVERTAEVVAFRADLRHALVPREHVERVLRSRTTRDIRLDWTRSIAPRLIWRWVRANGAEYVW